MANFKLWKKVYGVITPGGDPCWECPECGYRHLYGVENADYPKHKCVECGIELFYPWEEELSKNNENDSQSVY